MLATFFARVSFVNLKQPISVFFASILIKFFFTISKSGDEEIATKKNSHETAKENVKQRELHAISIATRKKFCLVHEISGAKIKPVSK